MPLRDNARAEQTSLVPLGACGSALALGFAYVAYLSRFFSYETPQNERPLIWVLALFGIGFLGYLCSIPIALSSRSRHLFGAIFGFALLFRALLLCSEPIQEIDIYRYVWDGVATASGVSPFEFTPEEVLAAGTNGASPELQRLVAARDSSPTVRTLLERVHFPELPTVYPPVSQAVFALAASTTPSAGSAAVRINVMKLWLLLFDLGTIVVLAATLRYVGMHVGWLVSYAWCPLVLKEFANSGHLDSIAVFLSVLAVHLAMKAFFPREQDDQLRNAGFRIAGFISAAFAAGLLGLAVGAKLYPVVLVPLMLLTAFNRFGASKTGLLGAVWFVVTSVCLLPMLRTSNQPHASPSENPFETVPAVETAPLAAEIDNEPLESLAKSVQVEAESEFQPGDRAAGLKVFLSRWMMNDFIFLNVAENVTPDRLRDGAPTPWFVFVPDPARDYMNALIANRFDIDEARVPFLIARTLTGIAFGCLCLYWAYRSMSTSDVAEWGQYVFLTLAWFWLLLPTLNPWYWIWALPWIAFTKNRVWLLMSGLLFIYYLRFFIASHFEGRQVVDWIPYQGAVFFDYVVVWLEYLPWFLVLAVTYWWQTRVKHAEQPDSPKISTS